MKACKVRKNIVLIYFLGVVISIVSVGSQLTKASQGQVDTPQEQLQSNTKLENESDTSQPANLSDNQNTNHYNPLSFSIDSDNVEFNQDLQEVNGVLYSNHFYSNDKFNFRYQNLISETDLDLTLSAVSTFNFQVSLISAEPENLVIDQGHANNTDNQHHFTFKSIQEPFYIQIETLGESFSIQDIHIDSHPTNMQEGNTEELEAQEAQDPEPEPEQAQ